jgi:protease II
VQLLICARLTARQSASERAAARAGALLAAQAMNKVPSAFAAALLRRPFVTLLNSMTDPSLPMTAHEYDEWGDPAQPDVVRMWSQLSPHKQIVDAECAATVSTVHAAATSKHEGIDGTARNQPSIHYRLYAVRTGVGPSLRAEITRR